MPVRVSYWTGWLDPLMIAVSKEVFQLSPHFPGSWVFGLSMRDGVNLSMRRRSLGVPMALYPAVRLLIPLIERRFDVTHIYTSLADWHFLRAAGSRPIVLTVTQAGAPADTRLLQKVSIVVAETEQLASVARTCGVDNTRIRVIYPGVDLKAFSLTAPPPLPWRCLFASSPENVHELATKGVDLLLSLATREPGLEITLLWRPFGPQSSLALQKVREMQLPNVKIVEGRVTNIYDFYRLTHFTVAPFRTGGKPCPNSVLEGLASARPALVSGSVDVADLITREGAGVAFQPTPAGIHEGFQRLRDEYEVRQQGARRCAEKYFDIEDTVSAYRSIYESLASRH